MSDFDPFTATFDEAQAQPDPYRVRGPITQFFGAQDLILNRSFYEEHPLHGVSVCMRDDLVAPEWLAKAYLRCFRAATHGNVRTWDEAFGPAHKRGANLGAIRRRRLNCSKVTTAFIAEIARAPDRPIDKAFWEDVGSKIGEGATNAEELYRSMLRAGLAIDAETVRRNYRCGSKPAKLQKLAGVRRRSR